MPGLLRLCRVIVALPAAFAFGWLAGPHIGAALGRLDQPEIDLDVTP
jgi:hypothetical protein